MTQSMPLIDMSTADLESELDRWKQKVAFQKLAWNARYTFAQSVCDSIQAELDRRDVLNPSINPKETE